MSAETQAFVVPTTIGEALEQLGEEDSIALGGGTSVGLLVGQGLIEPTKIVSLAKIDGLGRIDVEAQQMVIGAMVTLRQLAQHPQVRSATPALAKAAGLVGNPRVRAVATVGGAVAHGDPRQDLPPVLMALGAVVRLSGTRGTREVPLEEFFTGFMETVLGPGELITSVVVPVVVGQRSEYLRYTPASAADFPTVGVAAVVSRDGSGAVSGARLALGGVGPTPIFVPEAAALAGATDTDAAIEEIARAATSRAEPIDDRLGSAAYKKAMTAVWTRRALRACLSEPASNGHS